MLRDRFTKLAGVVSVSFEWLALLIDYNRYPQYWGGRYPISYYATLPGTRLVFSVCYFIAAASFWIFAQHHLRARLSIPIRTFALSMLCFAGTALVPYDPNNSASSTVHSALAALTFSTFILGIFLVAKGGKGMVRYVSAGAGAASGTLLLVLVATPKGSPLTFGLEAGSWFVCQLWIIWITYVAYRNPAV